MIKRGTDSTPSASPDHRIAKRPTAADRSMLASLPAEIREAYKTLAECGVNEVRLCNLIRSKRDSNGAQEMEPISADDVMMFVDSPLKITEAYNALVEYGVGAVRLRYLIRRRKRTIGRPRNTDPIARLHFEVGLFEEDHPAISVKGAIKAVLQKKASYQSLPQTEKDSWLRKLEVALSRHRRAITKPPN